ncbi:MAG: 50S ribosomal protein L24 [Candidatus Aureabacteria bacterium]|nr:50S ribosomal protein L24 [Candidatus Auribacterota bacterium]
MKCKLRKGDEVEVIRGKDRGKKGKVLKVFHGINRAIVENINLVEKKQKPTQDNPKGGIIKIEESLPVSTLQIICSSCQKRTRIGIKLMENDQKLRYCKKCNESLDKK